MKKIIFGAVTLIILFFGFSIGFYSGTRYDPTFTHYSIRMLERTMADAGEAYYIRKLLENGQINKANNYLDLKLDTHLSEMKQLIGIAKDDETKSKARKMQLKINEFRATYKKTLN